MAAACIVLRDAPAATTPLYLNQSIAYLAVVATTRRHHWSHQPRSVWNALGKVVLFVSPAIAATKPPVSSVGTTAL